jgi:hypothetical protein
MGLRNSLAGRNIVLLHACAALAQRSIEATALGSMRPCRLPAIAVAIVR